MEVIVFEGCDGSGKTTLLNEVYNKYLQKDKREVILLREPGFSHVGEKVKEMLQEDGMDEFTKLLLLNASRKELLNFIKMHEDTDTIFLLDRFALSTYVYQVLGGVNRQVVDSIVSNTLDGFEVDLTILLDTDVKTLKERAARNGRDANESLHDFEDLKKRYEIEFDFLDYSMNKFIVDGDLPLDKQSHEVMEAMRLSNII